jgi:2,5-diketo-D-gluconate reductase A
MEELYRDGVIKAIGVSNFYPDRVMDFIAHHEAVPPVNQIETHPFHQQVQRKSFSKKTTFTWNYWGHLLRAAMRSSPISGCDRLARIKKTHRTSDFAMAHPKEGVVVILKSIRKERMEENFSIFDFALSNDDISSIATLSSFKLNDNADTAGGHKSNERY